MNPRQQVLIVDDKKENLLAMRRVLADLDIDIVEAAGGNEALAATLDHDFALAILDIMMPDMDGFELAGYLKGDAKTRNIPIIFLTAVFFEEERIFKGYEAGAVDYIVKPYKPEVLLSKVRVFLDLERVRSKLAEKIAAQKAAEQELRESESLYRAIARNFPDGAVYIFDHDLRFRVADGQAMAALGFRRAMPSGVGW
jgi:CheY-like chemotaxis protein